MWGFIFRALVSFLMRLLTFIFESYFYPFTKNFGGASTLSVAHHFMTNLKQKIAVTPFAVGH
jgi:hypothetical protein